MSNPGSETDLGIPGIVDAVLIGQSPSAATYQVRDAGSGNVAIVKILNAPGIRADRLDRFRAEQRVIQDLASHPNILTVYGTGVTSGGLPYVVSEPVRGGSLADRLTGPDRLQGPDILSLGIRMAGALESAHRGGVAHGDLRPEDIMLTETGDPLLADFGVVALTGTGVGNTDDPRRLTHAAPELLDGDSPGPATDLYALASALYQLFAGKPAFVRPEDMSVIPVIKRIASSPLPDLALMGVPASVAAVITKAMSKDPAGRYESAEELGRALQQAQLVGGFPMTEMPMLTPPSRVPASWLDRPKVPGPAGGNGPAPAGGPPGPGGPGAGGPGPGGPGPGGPGTGSRRRAPLIAAVSLLAVALIGGGVFAATREDDDGGGDDDKTEQAGGEPTGLGSTPVELKNGDEAVVHTVTNIAKDSVLLIKVNPQDNDFDPKITVTTGDGDVQDQYEEFFPDDSRIFPVGKDDVLSDVADTDDIDGDALLVPLNTGGTGDTDAEVFPVPFGGDFDIVVFSGDGDSDGKATVDIKAQTFANAPDDGQDYLDKLAGQKFVSRFAGDVTFELEPADEGSDVATDDVSDEVVDEVAIGNQKAEEEFASGASMVVEFPETWTFATAEEGGDPILVAALGDPETLDDGSFVQEGVRIDGFAPGNGGSDPNDLDAFLASQAEDRGLTANCTPGVPTDYATAAAVTDDEIFVGSGQRFTACAGGLGGEVVLLVIAPNPGREFTVTLEVHLGVLENEGGLASVASSFNLFNFPPA